MEIAGFPHYENVCSNILKYFIDPQKEHGLTNLVLNSVLECINENIELSSECESVSVMREVVTKNSKRLDLLVISNNYVIGIENKIYHILNNDLSEYRETIQSYCNNQKKPICVVLSLRRLNNASDIELMNRNGFINITHAEIFRKVRSKSGHYFNVSNSTYYSYLNDFMTTIENLTAKPKEEVMLNNYFKQNYTTIEDLVSKYEDYKNSIKRQISILEEAVSKDICAPAADRQWRYKDNCLVHDYSIGEAKIAIDAYVNVSGWVIWLFARDPKSRSILIDTLLNHEGFLKMPLDQYEHGTFENNYRIKIGVFANDEDINLVSACLIDQLQRLENAKSRLTIVAADSARHLSGRSLQSAIRFRFCASTKATPKIFGVFMPHCVCPEKLRISKSF